MKYSSYLFALLAAMTLLLAACSSSVPNPSTAAPANPTGDPAVTATLPPAPTATLEPTPTPQPQRALLLAPDTAAPELAASLESLLAEWAGQEGLRFQRVPALAPADLAADPARLVVALPPDQGLAGLAAAAPDTQFLAVGVDGLTAGGNLSLLSASGGASAQQAFLAGYLAAVITPQWRVAALVPPGSPAVPAFSNGVIFYCGLCRPAYPPFVQYPLTVEILPESGAAEFQSVVDGLTAQGVQTVYVAPGAGDDVLLQALAGANLQLIGAGDPPPGIQNQWVASVQADLLPAVRDLLPRLMQGEGGLAQDVPLLLAHTNENLLSPGRQGMVEETLADLTAGYIDPGSAPPAP